MQLPKKILVPFDFSQSSERALAYAVGLAEAFGGEVLVMHAYELPILGLPEGMSVGGADLLTRIVEGAQKGLDDAIAPYADRNVEVSAAIDQEEPWRAILARAEAGRADLIVMGTHGRRGLPRALLGSVAEKVVRTAGCPVLTVRAEVTEP